MLSKKLKKRDFLTLLVIGVVFAVSLVLKAEPTQSPLPKGIGPIKELKLEEIKNDLATSGKSVFVAKCSACHKMVERYVGPGLKDITKRRSPEWIMNMILNPVEMTQKDPVAQELLAEYLTQMTFQNVTEAETRSLLEYFRYYDANGELIDKVDPKKTKKVENGKQKKGKLKEESSKHKKEKKH